MPKFKICSTNVYFVTVFHGGIVAFRCNKLPLFVTTPLYKHKANHYVERGEVKSPKSSIPKDTVTFR